MRLRDIIGLVLALVLAVGVALLTRIFLTKEGEPARIEKIVSKPMKVTKVLVAGKSLDEGDRVAAGDLVWQEWPQAFLNPHYVTEYTAKIDDFVGSISRDRIDEGEPIVLKDFVKIGERGILSALLNAGKRAISIDISPTTASSGLINPGDYVDVILSTSTSKDDKQQEIKTETILKNIKVIAIDADLSAPEGKPNASPHVATLEVTPAQAELLVAGAREGTLNLSLHSLDKTEEKNGIDPASGLPIKTKVKIMRGKDTNTVEFTDNREDTEASENK